MRQQDFLKQLFESIEHKEYVLLGNNINLLRTGVNGSDIDIVSSVSDFGNLISILQRLIDHVDGLSIVLSIKSPRYYYIRLIYTSSVRAWGLAIDVLNDGSYYRGVQWSYYKELSVEPRIVDNIFFVSEETYKWTKTMKFELRTHSIGLSLYIKNSIYSRIPGYVHKGMTRRSVSYVSKNVSIWNDIKLVKYKLKSNPRLVLSVSGPDGVGKSTLINHLEKIFQDAFNKNVCLMHLRPGLFRRLSAFKKGEHQQETTAVPQLVESSYAMSLLKIGYYFLDYTIGYFIRVRLISWRTPTVFIFDRYYTDLLSQPARFGIKGFSGLRTFLFRFIPKPQLSVLLYEDPENILRRKAELTLEELSCEIERQKLLFDQNIFDIRIKNESTISSMHSVLRELS
jgi:thymidylate kinase